MKRRTQWIAILAILSMVTVACGGETSDSATTAADTTAEAPDTTSGGSTETTASESPDTTTSEGEAPDGEPIVFGASLPLTGEFSIVGTKHAAGYQFCIDELNARGGVLGRPVELKVEDNRSETELTVTQTERFINVENVDALFGTFSSLLSFPASTVAEQNGMVYPVPSGGALRLWERGYQNMFYFQQVPSEYTGSSIVNLIDHYEETRRGVYGGVVGYIDFHGDLDMAIAIRTAVLRGGTAYVQAGAGIVADSDPLSEHRECIAKATAALRAVATAASMRPIGGTGEGGR